MNTEINDNPRRTEIQDFERLNKLAAAWLRAEGVWATVGIANVVFTASVKKWYGRKVEKKDGLVMAVTTLFPIKPKVAAHFEQFIQANHSTFLQVQWFSQKA